MWTIHLNHLNGVTHVVIFLSTWSRFSYVCDKCEMSLIILNHRQFFPSKSVTLGCALGEQLIKIKGWVMTSLEDFENPVGTQIACCYEQSASILAKLLSCYLRKMNTQTGLLGVVDCFSKHCKRRCPTPPSPLKSWVGIFTAFSPNGSSEIPLHTLKKPGQKLVRSSWLWCETEEPLFFLAGCTIVLFNGSWIARKLQSLCGDI